MTRKITSVRPAKSLRFLVLDDNWTHAELMTMWLQREFPNAVITVIETAKQFMRNLNNVEKDPPDVFILDMMVRYTDVGDPDPVTNGSEEDFFQAGARCYDELKSKGLANRVIIYSVIEAENLRAANLSELISIFVQKGEDKSALLDAIRRIV